MFSEKRFLTVVDWPGAQTFHFINATAVVPSTAFAAVDLKLLKGAN